MIEKLLGHDIAVSAFLERFNSGRFPHAWEGKEQKERTGT